MDLSELLAPFALFAGLFVIAVAVIRGRLRADSRLGPRVRRARQSFDLLAALPSALLALLVVFGAIYWLSEVEFSPWLVAPVFLAFAVVAFYAMPTALLWISVATLTYLRRRYALDHAETRELVAAVFPDRYRERVERRLLGDNDP